MRSQPCFRLLLGKRHVRLAGANVAGVQAMSEPSTVRTAVRARHRSVY
jgi:hypothetical protein